jgi:hypothetical protein
MREKKTNKNNKEEQIGEALLKVALGYQVSEVTEEYAEVDGELKLTKRKKTRKDIPPDLKAVQLLLSTAQGKEISAWTDEELEREREKLLSELEKTSLAKEQDGDGKKNKKRKGGTHVFDEQEK